MKRQFDIDYVVAHPSPSMGLYCMDGPWRGLVLYLSDARCTAVLDIPVDRWGQRQSMRGRYVRQNDCCVSPDLGKTTYLQAFWEEHAR